MHALAAFSRLRLARAAGIVCLCVLISCAPPAPNPNPGATLPAATVIAQTGKTQWKLVYFGDSDMWYSCDVYIKYFEQDLGVSITPYNGTRMTMPSASWLETLRTDKELRAQIAAADVITFNVPLVSPLIGGACFDYQAKMEDGCFGESQAVFAENTRQIIREIKALVGQKGALIRLQNGYVPVDWWKDNEYLKERAAPCLACFAGYWQAQAAAAAGEGIAVIDIFTAFHGPNHDQNPAASGLISDDGIHVSDRGAAAEADLYRAAGYGWWKP